MPIVHKPTFDFAVHKTIKGHETDMNEYEREFTLFLTIVVKSDSIEKYYALLYVVRVLS